VSREIPIPTLFLAARAAMGANNREQNWMPKVEMCLLMTKSQSGQVDICRVLY
jgi:hypothetical protein